MKIILSVAVTIAALFTTGAQAEVIKDIHIGAGSADISIGSTSNSDTQYNIGWGVTSYMDTGFLWGIDFELSMIDSDADPIYGFGADLKLGYNNKSFAVYGIGAVLGQDLNNGSDSSTGTGLGAGIEYRVTDWIAISASYKTYSMASSTLDYDYDLVHVNLKYIF